MVTRERYEQQLIKLNMNISDMGRMLIDSMENVKVVIKENDKKSAYRIHDNDSEIKDLARRVEERCIKLIMRQQPVATDLRVISAAIKLVTDLERMSKQTVDIAEIALDKTDEEQTKLTPILDEMADKALQITIDAVNAYMHNDLELVNKVTESDDIIDGLYSEIKQDIVSGVKKDTVGAETAVESLLKAKYLEKIGDHAENIVNWVNYAITGEQLK